MSSPNHLTVSIPVETSVLRALGYIHKTEVFDMTDDERASLIVAFGEIYDVLAAVAPRPELWQQATTPEDKAKYLRNLATTVANMYSNTESRLTELLDAQKEKPAS